MSKASNIHSTGLVVGGKGILLRGPSGAGKSLLALELLEHAELRGEKAALVSDDRIDLAVTGGKLIMQAPASIGGLIELRGRGIIERPHVKKAEVHLVADIVDKLERLVEEDELEVVLEGVRLPRCPLPKRSAVDAAHQRILIHEALRHIKPGKTARAKKTA